MISGSTYQHDKRSKMIQLKSTVNHAKASTKNWNNNLLASNTRLTVMLLQRSLYLGVLRKAHGLVAPQDCKLVDKLLRNST